MFSARFHFSFLGLLGIVVGLSACVESSIMLGTEDASRPDSAVEDSAAEDTGGRVDSTVRDGGGDDMGVSCSPALCEAPCRPYTVDGCEACYCPEDECRTDDECVLANFTGTCCPGCVEAFPRDAIGENDCIVELYTPAVPECVAVGCEEVPCPPVSCARANRAKCDSGTCQAASDCLPDQVITPQGCAPRCAVDTDCAIRRDASLCCPPCEVVIHQRFADSLGCFFEEGETPPPECLPDPESCRGEPCPDPLCPDIREATCNVESGLCEGSGPAMMM